MRYDDYSDIKDYIQELDDREILLNLRRETKIGMMKKARLKQAAVMALTFGTITLFSITSILSKKQSDYNSKTDYSSQVESMFDVSIDNEQEQILDGLKSKLELIDEYENAESDRSKLEILKEMDESKEDVWWDAITLVKMKLANEHGGDYTDYTIGFSSDDLNAGYFYEKTRLGDNDQKEVYEKGKVDSKFFDTTTEYYISKADSLRHDSFDIDNLGHDANKFVRLYKQVVVGAGDFIGKTSDKAK